MAIKAINSVNFEGKAQTKNGNAYDKTNVGKYAGMATGATACAVYPLYKTNKMLKTTQGKRFVIDYFQNLHGHLTDVFNDQAPTRKELSAYVRTCIKVGKIVTPVVSGALGLVAGLGLGAIVDGVINHCRAKKADNN